MLVVITHFAIIVAFSVILFNETSCTGHLERFCLILVLFEPKFGSILLLDIVCIGFDVRYEIINSGDCSRYQMINL